MCQSLIVKTTQNEYCNYFLTVTVFRVESCLFGRNVGIVNGNKTSNVKYPYTDAINSAYRWWWCHADYECGGDVGFETFTRELMEAVSTVTISDNKIIFFSIQHAMAIAVAA